MCSGGHDVAVIPSQLAGSQQHFSEPVAVADRRRAPSRGFVSGRSADSGRSGCSAFGRRRSSDRWPASSLRVTLPGSARSFGCLPEPREAAATAEIDPMDVAGFGERAEGGSGFRFSSRLLQKGCARLGGARAGASAGAGIDDPAGPAGAGQAASGVVVWRQSLRRLPVAVISRHSERQADLPRRWKRSMRRLNFVSAKMGSIIALRCP